MGALYNILIWLLSSWRPALLFSFKALMQLWAFGFKMFLASLLDAVFTRLDYLIIGKLFAPTTLGFFQRAKELNMYMARFASNSLMSVLFPVFSQVKNNTQRMQEIVGKTLSILSFVVFLMLGGFYLVSNEFIMIAFGEKWLPSLPFLQMIILSSFSYPLSGVYLNILRSKGRSREFLRLEFYKKSLLGCNFIVLYLWGIDAYLYGLVVTSVLGLLLNTYYASRVIELTFFKLIKPVLEQLGVVVVTVNFILYIIPAISLGVVWVFFIKGGLFVGMFVLVNELLKIKSYLYVKDVIFSGFEVLKLRFYNEIGGGDFDSNK